MISVCLDSLWVNQPLLLTLRWREQRQRRVPICPKRSYAKAWPDTKVYGPSNSMAHSQTRFNLFLNRGGTQEWASRPELKPYGYILHNRLTWPCRRNLNAIRGSSFVNCSSYLLSFNIWFLFGPRCSVVIKALRYKTEGRGFEKRRGE